LCFDPDENIANQIHISVHGASFFLSHFRGSAWRRPS
jgi:hypothetical protein